MPPEPPEAAAHPAVQMAMPLAPPPVEIHDPINQPRGHVRMAVMDAKTIGHRVRLISKFYL